MDYENTSLCELMKEAFRLSLECVYKNYDENGNYYEARPIEFWDSLILKDQFGNIIKDNSDLIGRWADGLMHKYWENISTRRCSLNAMINFDIEKFEQRAIHDIKFMKAILEKVGLPTQINRFNLQSD